MNTAYIIICGGRDFNNYKILESSVNFNISYLKLKNKIKIISGCAPGGDTLGEKYAKQYNYDIIKIPADWKKYGKPAGFIRNSEMIKIASHVIAFWDGQSKGTKHTIDSAIKKGIPVKVVDIRMDEYGLYVLDDLINLNIYKEKTEKLLEKLEEINDHS